MKKRFAEDLKNGELKYFVFSIGGDEEWDKKLKDEYKVKSILMGCTSFPSELDCYNYEVRQYLKSKYKFDILNDKFSAIIL